MTAPVARRGFSEEAVRALSERQDEPAWMRERRLEAWKIYESLPMPTLQDEEWRRTSLRALKLNDIAPFTEDSAAAESLLPEAERDEKFAGVLGLREGEQVEYTLRDDLRAQGVIFSDLRSAIREHGDLVRRHFMARCVPPGDSKFAALHGAFWQNGVFLYVPKGVTITEPFRVIVSAGLYGTASLSHTLVVLADEAQATLVEDTISDETSEQGLSSRVVELIQERGSVLHYVGTQRLGRSAYDFHTERALLGRDTNLILQTVELGSRLSKGRVETILMGDGASAKLHGLYIADGKQHLDRYTLQDHRAASGTSDLLFKGVITDDARSVFSGLIRVTPEGKGTAAYQQNRNLLLSRTARADSIPNLEIGANDIIGCSHGATVGKVDEEQLFYLMCRGLSRLEATRLIVEGFVDPLVAEVPVAGLRDALRREISARVGAAETALAS
ncbi:MAG TPA: Fe-S cluster assembly protein SufD [Ktedonobacterales bacterium]|nr:Fe-S cluster assembly protein SufD [Ktedonobacterales bacterium]